MKRALPIGLWLLSACAHREPLPEPSSPLVATSRAEFPARPLASEPAATVELPQIASFRLPNGLTVLAVERPAASAVSLRYVAAQGGEDRPLGELGWATLSRRITERALERTNDVDALARLGEAQSSGGTDQLASWLALETDPELFEDTVRLLVAALRDHAMPSEIIADALDDQLDALHHELFQQGELARNHAHQILYGEQHPLGLSHNGTFDSLKVLTVEQLRVRHAAVFAPEHSALVVVGKIEIATLSAQLTQAFSDLPASGASLAAAPPIGERTERRARGLLTRGRTAHVTESYRAPPHGSVDDAPFQLLRLISGSLWSSRLMTALRERDTFTYAVGASLSFHREGATFDIETEVEPSSLLAALRVIDEQIARLREAPITPAELALAKLQAREIFAQRFEDESYACAVIARNFALHGQAFAAAPGQSLRAQLEAIEAVSAERVREVAARYLAPERRAVAVAGPLLDFEFELSRWYGLGVEFFVPTKYKRYFD